jgi:hypothetical protein
VVTLPPPPKRSLAVALLTLTLALLTGRPVSAADDVAEKLFQEAVALMKQLKFEDACPKLAESARREPRSGTLLNLAACQEQLGKTASARTLYAEAATLAQAEKRKSNVDKANLLAAALEKRLTRLHVDVIAPAPDETITLDGQLVEGGALGFTLPVDPGRHVIAASAPSCQDWSQAMDVGGDTTLSVPALSKVIEAAVPASAPPAEATRQDQARFATRVPSWAWITGGVGVALLATSVYFRVDQSKASDALDANCGARRQGCDPDYDFSAMRAREQRGFGLFIGLGTTGVVAVAAAALGFVMTRRARHGQTARMLPVLGLSASAARAGIQGSF